MASGDYLLRGAYIYQDGCFRQSDIGVSGGLIAEVSPGFSAKAVLDLDGLFLFPAFADLHVHTREPGFGYKETVKSACEAAAAGGYADIFAMANLSPVPDSLMGLWPELEAIERSATVKVHPYGAITVGLKGGKIAALEEMAPYVAAFSDDGKGVADASLMKEAMARAKALGKRIVAHCEDITLIPDGAAVHDGAWARSRNLPGIPSESEWRMLARDLELVSETLCPYHACHISTKESVRLVAEAKAAGLPVTAETAPHYLVLCDGDIPSTDGFAAGSFKMNPPLRGKEDREALVAGLESGAIDAVATDHAPHSYEEKSRGLCGSLFGVVGLETAFPVLYTDLVKTGRLSLERLIGAMSLRPREMFGLGICNFRPGDEASFVCVSDSENTVDPARFKSKGRATPFAGRRVSAKIEMTFCNGAMAYGKRDL